MIFLKQFIKKKYELVSNLSERCFLIHMILYKVILLFEVSFYTGFSIWFIMVCLTILNEKFHLWFTEKLFVFLFKSLPFNYHLYTFCMHWREALQKKDMSTYVALLSSVIGATVVMYILDPSSFDDMKFTWYTIIFVVLLSNYFKSILVPIFYPVRTSRTDKLHINAGKQQLRQFHSSRSLYMPFGKAGQEFAKDMKKFAFANPKLTAGTFLFGAAVPGTQHVYNKQRLADLEYNNAERSANLEHDNAVRSADLAHESSVAQEMERANKEKIDQIKNFNDFLQEQCTLANAKFNPGCVKYQEAFDLSFSAWKASTGL
jgi:hypothetical protein